MRIALRELRRRPGRFAVATVILTLISLLLMFLGGLLDGLVASSTGALRAQRADAVVYSATAQDSLVRSRIDGGVRQQVEDVVGAERVGGLGSVQLGGRLDGRGPRDLVPVVLFGYELAPRGLPDEPPGPGEVWADEALRSEDVEEGTTIRLGPARTEVTVVGFVSDSRYSGQGTLWGSIDTWRDVVGANRPGEATGDDVVQALVVRDDPARGGGDLGAAIDRSTDDATRTLTVDEAIEALPGVSQQRSTFNQIIGVTVVIALVVVALFFALLTVERVALYGVLKALGASSGTLFAGVLAQAVVVALIASTIGAAASLALDAVIPPGSIPFVAGASRLGSSIVIVLVAAVAGCAFSLRRVLKVDPATAIGGST
jgi:putative ABC transport system permease protein